MIAPTPLTAEILIDMPDDGRRIELRQGRIVEMSPIRRQHGQAVLRLIVALDQYVRATGLGEVLPGLQMPVADLFDLG